VTVVARLDDQPFDPAAELQAVIGAATGDGAVVSFVGLARPKSTEGANIESLVLDHHPTLTQRSLEQIAHDAAERFSVHHIWVVHRCGIIPVGQPIVFAAAAAPHRRPAFEAADFLMDRLKTEAVLWKREEGPAGSSWIEPREADYADRGRWE
jgi:molybdopterin synthase catalytic subunit